MAFILFIFWFVSYRRRSNAKVGELQDQLAVSELYGEKTPQHPGQLPGILEMSATERRAEMGAGGSHELPVGLAS